MGRDCLGMAPLLFFFFCGVKKNRSTVVKAVKISDKPDFSLFLPQLCCDKDLFSSTDNRRAGFYYYYFIVA